jgi:XTP/dITP diphosphohydrolase
MANLSFILASSNNHKALEFAELFIGSGVEVVAAPHKIDVDEDGETFIENSHKKAMAYYKQFNTPVLADDSGLVVEDLPNELGIYSARFGGDGLTDKDRAYLLLEKLSKLDPNIERKAYFVCLLTFVLNDKEIYSFEGRVEGHIGKNYLGETGFGYDPVFIPLNGPKNADGRPLTLVECHDWKQKNSHRARATQFARDFFQQGRGQKS